jgi:hypothetical protein
LLVWMHSLAMGDLALFNQVDHGQPRSVAP